LGAGIVLRAREGRSRLLPSDFRSGLPAIFDSALLTAREDVVKSNFSPDRLRRLARLYQSNRFFEQARACYEIPSLARALDARDHYYLADIAENENDHTEAQRELRAVLATDGAYIPARLELADILFKTGDDAGAEREYMAALAGEANQADALFGLARIDLLRGHDDAAEARLVGLMGNHPEMTSGAALLAQVFARRGKSEQAAAMAQWSRQKPAPAPTDPWMEALLEDCYDIQRLGLKFEEYFSSGEIDKAVPLLRRIQELDPVSPIPHILKGWTDARDHKDAAAVDEYRQALAKGADPEKIGPYLAASLETLGRSKEALQLLAGFSEKSPDSIPILISYAGAAVQAGNVALAKALLSKVVQKEPYLFAANIELAKILWEAGDREGAAQCLRRVVEIAPKDVTSRAMLGEYYLGKDDPTSAVSFLERALELSNSQPAEHKQLVNLLYSAYLGAANGLAESGGSSTAALQLVEKASLLAPNEPAAYALKAELGVRSKVYSSAVDALGKLLVLQPSNPTVYLSLGDVLYEEGDRAGAERNWRLALGYVSANDSELRAAISKRINGPISEETFR
jgi:tetratricopeptide (TPR) repeat protein